MQDTRVYRSADIGSNHYRVRTTIKLRLKRTEERSGSRFNYDTSKLKDEDVLKVFNIMLRNRYQVPEEES